MSFFSLRACHAALFGVRHTLRILSRTGFWTPDFLGWIPVREDLRVPFHEASFRYSVTPGDDLGLRMYWRGIRNLPPSLELFAALARKASFALDIGANTGIWSLAACALNPRLRITAFEPVTWIYEVLVRNIHLNRLESRLQALPMAVADAAGTVELFIPPSSVRATLDRDVAAHSTASVLTQVTTIDEILGENQRVDLVKIDVEGCEDRVIAGMRNTLGRSRPNIILECHGERRGHSLAALLSPYGYKFHQVCRCGVLPVDCPGQHAHDEDYDYLCTPESGAVDSYAATAAPLRTPIYPPPL